MPAKLQQQQQQQPQVRRRSSLLIWRQSRTCCLLRRQCHDTPSVCTLVSGLYASRPSPSLYLSIHREVDLLSEMTWCQRTGTGQAGSASVLAATVSPQPMASRRMVLVAAVWLVVLMSLTDVVVRVDGFVVEPASSLLTSFQRRLNDSVKPSSTGLSNSRPLSHTERQKSLRGRAEK